MRFIAPKSAFVGAITAAGLSALSLAAAAEEVIIYQGVPTAEEVSNVLFGKGKSIVDGQRTRSFRSKEKAPVARAQREKTRAIRLHEPENQTPKETGTQIAAASDDVPIDQTSGVGLGFNLQFAFDSVELLPESKPYIDRLGEVMAATDNQDKTLLILGHTDAIGSDAYNLVLSQDRAQAVKSYLTTTWSISASRLQIDGVGEAQPLSGTEPADGINRRVEFYALN